MTYSELVGTTSHQTPIPPQCAAHSSPIRTKRDPAPEQVGTSGHWKGDHKPSSWPNSKVAMSRQASDLEAFRHNPTDGTTGRSTESCVPVLLPPFYCLHVLLSPCYCCLHHTASVILLLSWCTNKVLLCMVQHNNNNN